jgi:hypothetical protein
MIPRDRGGGGTPRRASKKQKLIPLAVFLTTPLKEYLQAEIQSQEETLHRASEWNIV